MSNISEDTRKREGQMKVRSHLGSRVFGRENVDFRPSGGGFRPFHTFHSFPFVLSFMSPKNCRDVWTEPDSPLSPSLLRLVPRPTPGTYVKIQDDPTRKCPTETTLYTVQYLRTLGCVWTYVYIQLNLCSPPRV